MEEALAREQFAEHHVQLLLTDKSQPIDNVLQAFEDYRQICLEITFADFAHAHEHQTRLWHAHADGKRYFHEALRGLRKQGDGKCVEARQLAKLYKVWIKASVQHYTEFIKRLNATFGGIQELQAVAHSVKSDAASGSSQSTLVAEERAMVLASCHQALIWIGDLWRYRAHEKLDSTPDFGPAIGYYGLAITLRPSSGLGHHQQAVVALEQHVHLRAIYHLYRAIVVDEPHPAAANNLKIQFGKVNAAWEKGTLIPKSAPGDPDAAKLVLVGWSVRMYSMCAKGEVFSSHGELEREVLGQLSSVVRREVSMSETTLMRLVMVNLAAQYHAGVVFQEEQQAYAQQAFFYFFRLNIKAYTTLLQTFCDAVSGLPTEILEGEDLTKKLTSVMRRLLPALRLYSSWLTCNLHLVDGLRGDDFLADAIEALWTNYAQFVDVLADEDKFGIWALDDFVVTYMLEEDADTLGFKPLLDGQVINRNWQANIDGALKPRFSNAGVTCLSEDEEMLARMKNLLDDGSYLAHEAPSAPIGIVGGRIFYGQALQNALAAAEEAKNRPPQPPKVKAKPAPLSYAAAAKSGRAVVAPAVKPSNGQPSASTTTSRSRQAQMTRMIDNLVDDDDGNNPVTPPQQHASHPAVVTNGDAYYNNMANGHHADFTTTPYQSKPLQPKVIDTPPTTHTPRGTLAGNSAERLQSVSRFWDDAASPASTFPSGLPMGTLASPPAFHQRGAHSRVNSANSIRSRNSQGMNVGDSLSSLESAPAQHLQGLGMPVDGYTNFSDSNVASPLLFGAGGGIWSTGKGGRRNRSPPQNGQGLG